MVKNLPTPNLQQTLDFFIELILVFILAISPLLFGSVGIFAITIIEVNAFLILFLWLIKSAVRGSLELAQLPFNKYIALFLLFLAVQYALINFSIYKVSLGVVYTQKMKGEILKLISFLIFFYAAINNFQSRKKINKLILSLVIIGFSLSFLGIIQKLTGVKTIFWAKQSEPAGAFYSSFPNRNHFASYINIIVFLTLGNMFSRLTLLRGAFKGFTKKGIAKGVFISFQKGILFYMFALIVMSASSFYSLSRGGISSFLFGLIFFSILVLIKGLTKRGYLVLLAVLISISAMLVWIKAPDQILEKFSKVDTTKMPFAESVLGGRKVFADKAVDLIKDYPVLGVGFGAFEFIYNKRYSPQIKYVDTNYYIDHLHNDFLELICEIGLAGFSIFLFLAFLYVYFVMRVLAKRHDPFVVGTTAGAMAGLFSMCVHSLLDFNFHITSNAILFFVVAGLGIVIANSRTEGQEESSMIPHKILVIKKALLKLLVLIVSISIFFCTVRFVINPYISFRIAESGKTSVGSLKRAIKLDPLNDKYHFLLARCFIQEATVAADETRCAYVKLAESETKEAIRLNPWNEYYPVYLDWIKKTFNL
jgi:O-antigen ligase